MTRVTGMLLAALVIAPVHLAATGLGPGAWTRQQMEEFLLGAKVTTKKHLSVGVTQSARLSMTSGETIHDAHFQSVDEYKPTFQGTDGTELNFRDCYKYNIAAYRLDKLLGLNMVPVSVERKIGGETGAVTWWVDNVLMMERKRYKKKITPPDREGWNDQMYRIRVFNELVYNTDPNLGNLLITQGWDLWMVDFTRAFRVHEGLRHPKNLGMIDRKMLEELRSLDEGTLTSELRPVLNKLEIRALLARRDKIVEFFDDKIAQLGAAAVLCDAPRR
ncbi:MAG: hypothetical protein GY953_07120 [bacterium]|nr:hypothetical protein [bacterium]